MILDEVHHAGDERAWGDGIQRAFELAAKRLSLSGTPFRSDSARIPFVRYDVTAEGDLAHADYTYGYADALRDGGVVRPVYFPRVDGQMEWSTPSGDVLRASFADELARDQVSARLRTALSLDGDWLPTVLGQAHDRLRQIRRDQRDAGGLVIATDQEHAQGIARLLRNRFDTTADVVVSDDPQASRKIAEFAHNDRPWLVAVRMVSEGVDIPRLRVGVYATTTSTELFFRQAVGRFVRWQAGRATQKAYVYVPDDPRLRHHAFQIAEARRHVLRPPGEQRRRSRRARRTRRPGPPRRHGRAAVAVLGRVGDGHRHHVPRRHRGRGARLRPRPFRRRSPTHRHPTSTTTRRSRSTCPTSRPRPVWSRGVRSASPSRRTTCEPATPTSPSVSST